MILVLDNYDSFVHNVARHLREAGAGRVVVVRSDAIEPSGIRAMSPSHLVISPGPRAPRDAGVSVRAVRELGEEMPVLGICLGHQAVAEAFGARVVRAARPLHGRAASVHHGGDGILGGLPSPFPAGLYHSLEVEAGSIPPSLEVAAWGGAGEVMALRHRTRPVWGLQFHPESILTPAGPEILRRFLDLGANPRTGTPARALAADAGAERGS